MNDLVSLLPAIHTQTDRPPSPPLLFPSLQSLAKATIIAAILSCPNATGKTLKERVTNTSFCLAGWACFSLSLRFIPITKLVHSYLAPEVDTTIAISDMPFAGHYRRHLLLPENHQAILDAAENYVPDSPMSKNTEEKNITAKKIIVGSLAFFTAAILLKKSLCQLTNEAQAIHYVASCFFASALLYPFIPAFILPIIQQSLPAYTQKIADLRDFYDDADTLTIEEKKARIASVSYGIQQVRGKVLNKIKQNIKEMGAYDLYEDFMDYHPTHINKKNYIAIALGIIGLIHTIKPFTRPKTPLKLPKTTWMQKGSELLFELNYLYFSASFHQVVSAIINT